MSHRLSKIYTRTGDDGTTGLTDGSRVAKHSPRIEAIGCVDELNSAIGLLLVHELPEEVHTPLVTIQHTLFDLGGELSMPGTHILTAEHVTALEHTLDELNTGLAPLKEFILPGGTAAAAACHLSRAISRRAERRTLALNETETVNPAATKYLNRLSDLLFVIARYLNKSAGKADIFWRHERI